MTQFDMREVQQLARDLGHVPGRATGEVTKIVFKGAMNIKQDWAGRWRGLSHLPQLANAIDFDMKTSLTTIEAEIGVNKGKPQGPLGNIAEFGSVNNAPHPGGGPALKAEEPKFVTALADAIEKSFR